MRKGKKWIALGLTLAMCINSITGIGVMASGADAETDYRLRNPRVSFNTKEKVECIYFGNYWQEDTNWDGVANKNDKKTPIKWRILERNGDDVF